LDIASHTGQRQRRLGLVALGLCWFGRNNFYLNRPGPNRRQPCAKVRKRLDFASPETIWAAPISDGPLSSTTFSLDFGFGSGPSNRRMRIGAPTFGTTLSAGFGLALPQALTLAALHSSTTSPGNAWAS